MKGIDLKPELDELIHNVGTKSMYYGNKIPASVLSLFEVEITEETAGILVPYWISVLQRGRGPRKSTKDSGLIKKIYAWMERNNMFRSGTSKGKINEARFMTLYINKYGNKHFRSQVFVDIYESERKKTIEKIEKKFSLEIGKITMDIL
jgi:hypothetical protein